MFRAAIAYVLLVLLSGSIARAPVTHICMVNSEIDTTTIANLRGLNEVERIIIGSGKTSINIFRITRNVESILAGAGYDYVLEENLPIAIDAATSEWNLDRLDQSDHPLNGRYDPIGTGEAIQIYILDTGVNINHNDFGGRAIREYKLEAPCSSDASAQHHGSWVASVAAGTNFGAAKLATINDVKLPNGANCAFTVADAVQALIWLLSKPPPFIVSMSWNTVGASSQCIDDLVKDLRDLGAFLVAAGGNQNTLNGACGVSPAGSSSVMAIAASSMNGNSDARASFSNFGGCLWGFAPGVDINGASATSNSGSVNFDGTSASAPHVAGVAATLITRFNLVTPASVDAKLTELAALGRVGDAQGTPNRLLNLSAANLLQSIYFLLLSTLI